MRYTRSGFEHQTRDPTHWDMRTHAVFIDDDERAVEHVEMATFDVEDGQPFFDRKGFERWKEVGHQ